MKNFDKKVITNERMRFNRESGLYTTKKPFSTGTLQVYLNGVLLEPGKWCSYIIKGDQGIKLDKWMSWVSNKDHLIAAYTVKNRYNKINRKQPIMEQTTTKKVQRNIQKHFNKYRVRKNVNGVTIIKSFNKLVEARAFLRSIK